MEIRLTGPSSAAAKKVTEGEILEAIRRPLGARTLDGVKRRTRAGMGRCQAGFCSPRVMEILAAELHKDSDRNYEMRRSFSDGGRMDKGGWQWKQHEIVIIGGGPAGMAAALSAEEHGVRDVLILEREEELGGILNQCIHNGFGLHTFGEELTGPEYAARYEEWVKQRKLPCLTGTTVLGIRREEENGGEGLGNLHPKTVTAVNRDRGIFQIQASAVILAMGCRERPRGALNIPVIEHAI